MKEKILDKLLAKSLCSAVTRVEHKRGPGMKDIVYAILIKRVSNGDKKLISDRCKKLFRGLGCHKMYLCYDYDKILRH